MRESDCFSFLFFVFMKTEAGVRRNPNEEKKAVNCVRIFKMHVEKSLSARAHSNESKCYINWAFSSLRASEWLHRKFTSWKQILQTKRASTKINLLTPTECCAYFIRFQWESWLLNNVTHSRKAAVKCKQNEKKKTYFHFSICIAISMEQIFIRPSHLFIPNCLQLSKLYLSQTANTKAHSFLFY